MKSRRRNYSAPISQLWHLLHYRYIRKNAHIEGDPETVCKEILNRCWNGTFYTTSIGNFNYFWIRDFAAVAKSLRRLGHSDKVQATLRWALQHYMRENAVTLCITPSGRLFDAPKRGIDTLPSLIHCIWSIRYELSTAEKAFLNEQLTEFVRDFIDPGSGMLRPKLDYAELRDGVVYDRSAYTVAMVERMAYACENLGLNYPYRHELYQQELISHYWNGYYFSADYDNQAFSAECALVPFIMRSIEDTEKLNLTLDYIHQRGLALPYPIKYTDTPGKFRYRMWAKTVMRNYAGDTIWTWHGAYYLRLLWGQNRSEAPRYQSAFDDMIARYKTFPELLHPDGSMYNSLLYKSSEGMIWAAIYLALSDYKK